MAHPLRPLRAQLSRRESFMSEKPKDAKKLPLLGELAMPQGID